MKFKACLSWIAAFFFTASGYAAPVITSFSPTFGSSADPNYVVIKGSGFYPGTLKVYFGSTEAAPGYAATAADGTEIQARVRSGTPLGAVRIKVVVNGAQTFSVDDFQVIGAGPYISGFSPNAGSSETAVTITGAHFTGLSNVKFNGVNGRGAFAGTDGQISVKPPIGVTTGPIKVTTAQGSWTSTEYFYAPAILKSFTPSFGRIGTNVVIKGTNFLGAYAVRFNPGFTNFSPDFEVVDNNTIHVTIPIGAMTGKFEIDTPAGPVFSTSNFVVQPLITGFTPHKGQPGTNVTIFGENLLGATNVLFGSIKAGQPTGISYSQLTTKVPAGATNCFLTVQTPNGSFTISERFYLPPVIASFTPTFGPEGSTVKIVGTNFLDASAVTFNGQPATDFTVTNNETISAVIPPGVITGPISITTPYGTVTSDGNHLFYGLPIITGFTPLHGLPGTNVTILGTNFLGTTAVHFNGSNANFTLGTNGVLTAIVPTNATSGPISVTTLAGTTESAQPFTLDYSSDVAVTIAAPQTVLLGNDFTYVITITNSGPYAAPALTLTNWLPGQVTLKSASKTQGTLNTSGNPITGDLGTIPASGKVTVTLTVTPHEATTLSDTAAVASAFPDPNPTNNLTSVNTTIYVVPTLNLQIANGQVRLAWSVNLSGFVLQSSDNLSSSNSWENVAAEPQFDGDQKVVTETLGAGPKFYRLKH
ncbi:MAG TPA: IPT/TIG domain-containing protein [Verrucomicrobiae bacterium]